MSILLSCLMSFLQCHGTKLPSLFICVICALYHPWSSKKTHAKISILWNGVSVESVGIQADRAEHFHAPHCWICRLEISTGKGFIKVCFLRKWKIFYLSRTFLHNKSPIIIWCFNGGCAMKKHLSVLNCDSIYCGLPLWYSLGKVHWYI